jgi:RNA polymerase sigma-70 factor (ECF subfamily)
MDNTQIAQLVRTGAPEAFDALLDRFGGEIQGVAYLILRDRFDAEDVMSETLITAWQKGRELRDPSTLRSWLLRIATNKALSVRRKQSRSVQITDTMEFGSPDTTGPMATRLAMLAAVDDLPREMRAAIVLHYFSDLPVEEVARTLGKSPNTVKSQLRVGLERMRSAFDERTGQGGGRDAA